MSGDASRSPTYLVIPGRRGACGEREASSELAQDLWTENKNCMVVLCVPLQPPGLPAREPASLPVQYAFTQLSFPSL